MKDTNTVENILNIFKNVRKFVTPTSGDSDCFKRHLTVPPGNCGHECIKKK